jgi:hypothetical protein
MVEPKTTWWGVGAKGEDTGVPTAQATKPNSISWGQSVKSLFMQQSRSERSFYKVIYCRLLNLKLEQKQGFVSFFEALDARFL